MLHIIGVIIGLLLVFLGGFFRYRSYGSKYTHEYKNKKEEFISYAAVVIGMLLAAFSIGGI